MGRTCASEEAEEALKDLGGMREPVYSLFFGRMGAGMGQIK
jgi:hypothetical protein